MKDCKKGYYYCYTDKKCKRIPLGFKTVGPAGYLRKETGHTQDDDSENGKKNGGEEQRKRDEKKKKIDTFMDKAMPKRTFDQFGRETDRRTGKLK